MIRFPRRMAIAAFSVGLLFLTITSAAPYKVLVFTAWAGANHSGAIKVVGQDLLDMGPLSGFAAEVSDDPTKFTKANLAQYQVLVWDNNTIAGNILNTDQKAAFLDFMKSGKKGYLGIHAAADAKASWPEYSTLISGELSRHGAGMATINMEPSMAGNALTAGLAAQTAFDEEWYSYKSNPRKDPGVKVLYTLDEKTFSPGEVMGDHPITWIKVLPEGGRIWYTAMGHGPVIAATPFFKRQLLNAMAWVSAAGQISAIRAGAASSPSSHATLDRSADKPLTVSILRDGPHAVEIRGLDGRLVAARKGAGMAEYAFPEIAREAVYLVTTTGPGVRETRKVAVP